MIALVALLLLQQPEITFPDTSSVPVELKPAIETILKKEAWTAALKAIEEKLGPVRTKITIRLVEEADGSLASTETISQEENGKWRAVETVVSFNLAALARLDREMKSSKAKVPHAFPSYEKLVPHELAHALQGGEKSPEWFTEGLATWAADDPSFTLRYLATHQTVGKLEEATGDDAYGRGHLFFTWLEKKCGRAAFKTLHQLVHLDGVECRAALEKIANLKWAEIQAQEQAASSKRK